MTESYAMHLAEVLGYLSPDELLFLKKLARSINKKAPVIVNIGAGAGTSGLGLRESRPDAELYTIDIRPEGPLGGLQPERNAFDAAMMEYPIQILGDSKKVGETWTKPIDLLFIDGDHSEEGIKGDIRIWVPHVIEGGIIAFHDYKNTKWDEVKPAVDESMETQEYIGEENRIIAFRKKHD